MRYSPSEKLEIIRIVEDSELSVRQTLKELGIHRSTFYNWYRRYLDDGVEISTPKAMTLDEKEFIVEYILPDIIFSFGPLIITKPAPAEGEIEAESGVFADLVNADGSYVY